MRKKLILVDATPLQSEHKTRGVGTYTRNLVQGLTTVQSSTPISFITERSEMLPILSDVSSNIRIFRPHRPAQVYWLYNELILKEAVRRSQAALFHATDFNGLICVPGLKTVATLYDFTPMEDNGPCLTLSHVMSRLRWNIYFKEKIPQTDHIITISNVIRNEAIARLGLDSKRITVVPLGVNTRLYCPSESNEPRFHPRRYIAFVGSHEPHKNFSVLWSAFVQVAHLIPDLDLLICGRWSQQGVKAWSGSAEVHGLNNRVQHLPFLSTQDQVSFYRSALVLVVPSTAEGFGLPVLEAMACATPVIASDIPIFREVAAGAAMFFNPLQSEELAELILQIAQTDETRNSYAQMGLARSVMFGWDQVVKQTLDVYEKVLKV